VGDHAGILGAVVFVHFWLYLTSPGLKMSTFLTFTQGQDSSDPLFYFIYFFFPSTKFSHTFSYPVTRVFKVALPVFDDSMIYLLSNCVRHPNLEIIDIRGAPF
jgi:hypothetical protein